MHTGWAQGNTCRHLAVFWDQGTGEYMPPSACFVLHVCMFVLPLACIQPIDRLEQLHFWLYALWSIAMCYHPCIPVAHWLLCFYIPVAHWLLYFYIPVAHWLSYFYIPVAHWLQPLAPSATPVQHLDIFTIIPFTSAAQACSCNMCRKSLKTPPSAALPPPPSQGTT